VPAVRRLSSVVVVLLLAVGADAQTARLTVLADSVSAGLPFDVAVTVRHAPGAQVAFPPVPSAEARTLRLGDAEALAVERFPPSVRGAVRVDSAVYRAVVFAADSARVGPATVRVTSPQDTALVQTNAATVPVRSVLVGEAAPYEPAPVGPPEAFPSATPLWVGLGALALLLLVGAVWGIVQHLRRPKEVPAGPLPYPAAMARLDALDRAAPPAEAEPHAIEAHVVAVRDALRVYLADRLGLPARQATSAELAARVDADARVPAEAAAAVRRALTPTDLVAFARVRPGPAPVGRLRDATRAAVDAVEVALRAGNGERGTGNGAETPRPPGIVPSGTPQSPVPSP